MRIYKIVMPLSEVPPQTIITKITGTKRYRVLDKITIGSPKGTNPSIVEAQGGCRLIVPENDDFTHIGAWDGSKEVMVYMTRDEIMELVDPHCPK